VSIKGAAEIEIPSTLSCKISKIAKVPDKATWGINPEYREYLRDNGACEHHHQNNALSRQSWAVQISLPRIQHSMK
jgi:hypothetical protein